MLGMNDIRKGVTIVLDGQPFVVISADFLKKQQRRPVMRSVLKHLKTGQTKEHTFMQSEKIEPAQITKKDLQYIYTDSEGYKFMDPETYEQITLKAETLGEAVKFLLEEQTVSIQFFEDEPVTVDLPIKIDRQVLSAPPGIKGDTSTNVMKEVIVEGGVKVKAPLFIKSGDKIRIDTRSGEYVERA